MSGIPEIIHYKFQEEEEIESNFTEAYLPGYHFTISQMPSRDNKLGPGFGDEVLGLLNDWGLDIVASIIEKHDISLHRFLTLKDPDLRAFGINFSSDRKDVLDVIKKFHLCKWQTLTTFAMKPKDAHFTALDGLDMMSRLTQHFYIECATLAYLTTRFEDVVKRLSPDERNTFLKALETNIIQAQEMMESLKNSTQTLSGDLKLKASVEDKHPADFIGPKKWKMWSKKYCTITTVSVVIMMCLLNKKFEKFAHLPFFIK